MLCLLAALAAGSPLAAQSLVRIQNRHMSGSWLHTEEGSVTVGSIRPAWWSADWVLEPVADAPQFVRLRNRFRPSHYVHIEHGRVESGPLGAESWWSAQWRIEPVPGTSYSRIRSRFRDNQYLHTENGRLEVGTIRQEWWSAHWSLVRSPNEGSAVRASSQSTAQLQRVLRSLEASRLEVRLASRNTPRGHRDHERLNARLVVIDDSIAVVRRLLGER